MEHRNKGHITNERAAELPASHFNMARLSQRTMAEALERGRVIVAGVGEAHRGMSILNKERSSR